MLGRCQIGLSRGDIKPQLVIEDETDVNNDQDGQDQVGPISVGVLRPDVTKREDVQAGDVIIVSILADGEMRSPSATGIDG